MAGLLWQLSFPSHPCNFQSILMLQTLRDFVTA